MNFFDLNSYISQDWSVGYKLELDIAAKAKAKDWQLYFQMPYTIREFYGVDLNNNNNGSYTVSGLNDWDTLNSGQKVKAFFIIDTKGENAINPEFTSPDNTSSSQQKISVSFENHADNTRYDETVQKKDWDVELSTQLDKYGYISNQAPHTGTKSLRLRYPSDEQSNVGASWILPNQKVYYLSYWVLFAQNFDFDGPTLSGGKLPGLGSKGLCNGGGDCDGNNGFSSRYMWRENGRAVLYLYHMDKSGKYGDDLELKGNDGRTKYFQRGKWHNLVQRVRINDGDKSNGRIDVWMDGEKVLSRKNFRFVTNNQGVNRLFFSTFHGGSGEAWWPSEDVYAYFDDFVISIKASDVGL